MVDVSNAPLGSTNWTGQVRMGDPQPAPGQDPRLKVLVYPYPPTDPERPTYASWPVGAQGWESRDVPDDSCYFQVSEHKTALHAERAGPLDWLLIGGLF